LVFDSEITKKSSYKGKNDETQEPECKIRADPAEEPEDKEA
jgi:hypothetical protein